MILSLPGLYLREVSREHHLHTVIRLVSAWGHSSRKGQPSSLLPAGGGEDMAYKGLAGGSSHRHPFTPMPTSHLNRRRLQQGDLVLPAELQEAWQLFGKIHDLLHRDDGQLGEVSKAADGPPGSGDLVPLAKAAQKGEEGDKVP